MKSLPTLLAALALVAGAAALWMASGAADAAREASARSTALERRAGDLEGEVARLRTEIARPADAGADLGPRVEDLSRRVDALAARLAGPGPARAGAVAAGETAAAGGGEGIEGPPRPPVDPALRRIYDDLWQKVMNGTATAEEQQEFWRAVRTEGFMDGVLADLEAAVEGAPGSADARMELANGYIAKLFTVPPGPEMGIWASKAEGQWKEVLKRDENHWSARFALATSYSRYPEFLNKTPDAIREFEKVRSVQEILPPDPKHARTYVELSLLYTRQNQSDKAREVLEAGSRRHPEDEAIRKTLESLGR